jgi:hypothetical protein
MTADVLGRSRRRRKRGGGLLWLPFAALAAIVIAAGWFVSYVLWPTWPGKAIALDAPALPVTVAGVLFDVPPAAIRAAVQRQPGPHERVDLMFLWPSLEPPTSLDKTAANSATNTATNTVANTVPKPAAETAAAQDAVTAPPSVRDRLFVTIAGLGDVLPPVERLRTIYPRYVEAAATAGPDGLAVLAFRPGTPYAGEDLLYAADNPERFFARCTRVARAVPGTCLQERVLGAAEITVRFPRELLEQWRDAAVGFDRLVTRLHPGS